MKTTIIIAALLVTAAASSAQELQEQTPDSKDYCSFVNETAKATSTGLRTPSATAGFTSPNTGTQPQVYTGVTGSLSDYHKGRLTEEAARRNCELYKSTNDAQSAITFAQANLERQALQHRIAVLEMSIKQLDGLIAKNEEMVKAQVSTKVSLYALQASRLRLYSDKAKAEQDLTAHFIPDLPNAPLIRLVEEKQNDEERNQGAQAKLAKQNNWDLRWEGGYHKVISSSTPNPNSGVSSQGVYGGFNFNYNFGSKKVNQHLDAATRAYGDWKKNQDNDVVQEADQLRQQLVSAVSVTDARLVDLHEQEKTLQTLLDQVGSAQTSNSMLLLNQLTADKLVLDVDVKDAEFRLAGLKEYLSYNFPFSDVVPKGETRVSITFDDGYKSALLAAPILEKAGMKGTWYIITGYLGKDGYMSVDDVKALATQGQEIGSHTVDHPHLPTLTLAEQEREINGTVKAFDDMGLRVKSFAYPYGEHNDASLIALQESGFTTARTTDHTLSGRNPLLLPGFSIVPSTTPGQVISAMDEARRNGTWLIFTFHRIDENGNAISASHELLQTIVDYLVKNQIKVVPVSEGKQ